ncbi:MAG: aspartate/glutamate racemase family protein [Thermovirgaceae bacterium]
MKTIGLIGGLTWESTVEYYRIINELVSRKLGGTHSAKMILWSFDFQEFDHHMNTGEWASIGEKVSDAADILERAGAQLLLICSNTIHKVAEAADGTVGIPLLHIVDTAAAAIREKGFQTVGLLGTKFTMEEDFYRDRLKVMHAIDAIIPDEEDRRFINHVINEELTFGEILPESRDRFLEIIAKLSENGAQGVVLGCTEIPLLVQQKHTEVPIFDTMKLHCMAAVEAALEEDVS